MAGPPPASVVPREPGEIRRRTGGLVAAIGGAAVVAGSFADWVRADISTIGIREGTGWRNVNGNVAHGPWFAAMGAVLVVLGACYVVGLRPARARWAGVLVALAAIGLAIYEIVDITRAVTGVSTKLQPGLWIIIVGGGVTLVGLLLAGGGAPLTAPNDPAALTPMPYPAAPPVPGDPSAPAAPPVAAPVAAPLPPPVVPLPTASAPAAPDPSSTTAWWTPPPAPAAEGESPTPSESPDPPVPPADPTLLG
jgi:hypothetical protein